MIKKSWQLREISDTILERISTDMVGFVGLPGHLDPLQLQDPQVLQYPQSLLLWLLLFCCRALGRALFSAVTVMGEGCSMDCSELSICRWALNHDMGCLSSPSFLN